VASAVGIGLQLLPALSYTVSKLRGISRDVATGRLKWVFLLLVLFTAERLSLFETLSLLELSSTSEIEPQSEDCLLEERR
jgi:hypothetical protein